nr:sigma factor-like helix-turn-helix DNA-binding protein [Streptomyces sp. SID3343]
MEGALSLYSAVVRLPDRHYDTLVLRCVLGYPEAQVARQLGTRETTVRSNLRWARRRLAKELGTSEGEDVR